MIKKQVKRNRKIVTGRGNGSVGSAAEAIKWTVLSRNRRALVEVSDFPVIGGGEIGGSEEDAVGCGKRSHGDFEKETREERMQEDQKKKEYG